MEKVFIAHIVVFCLSDAYFCPLRPDKAYKKLFVKNFPFISLMSVSYFVFSLAYLFISDWIFSDNYIDGFCNLKIAFILLLYTIIIFAINIKIVKKEIQNASPEAKNAKFLLIPVILIFLYTSSVVWGAIVIHFTNRVLDFSRAEKQVRQIDSGQINISNKDYKPNVYYLMIRPDIYGHHTLEVSKSVFDKAKNLSRYNKTTDNQFSNITRFNFGDEIKLEVNLYKGLYGIRYVGNKMDVIKVSSVSSDIFPYFRHLKDYTVQSDNFPGFIPLKK